MKKSEMFLLGAIVFTAASCLSIQKQTAIQTPTHDYVVRIENGYDLKLTTVTIDSCEYLVGIVGYDQKSAVLTHKGNCKYCASRQSTKQ